MTKFLQLASEAELLGKADDQMDAEIWCEAFAPAGAYVEQSKLNGVWCIYHGVNARSGTQRLWEGMKGRVQPVTKSIDAALLLLPRGSMWSACYMEEGPYAQVIRPMPDGGYVNGLTTGRGVTAPLSICAAALRALAGASTFTATARGDAS